MLGCVILDQELTPVVVTHVTESYIAAPISSRRVGKVGYRDRFGPNPSQNSTLPHGMTHFGAAMWDYVMASLPDRLF